MKQLSIFYSVFVAFILASCSGNDEPDYPLYMQPSSIQSMDANGANQTFEYDDYGRIVSWHYVSNNPDDRVSYSAQYSYPDENTIEVTAEELIPNQQRIFVETIQLHNGRASKSEGTLSATVHTDEKTSKLQKTYRLIFGYLPTNHLNTVEHLEVFGIGDELKDNAWDSAWRWMNYLIWENGNLKEFQDYSGNSSVWRTSKYEYSMYATAYPVVVPMVINSAHHLPLFMQGVFGLTSVNLVESVSTFDDNGALSFSRQYSYRFEQDRISGYTETLFANSAISNPITYTVSWAAK